MSMKAIALMLLAASSLQAAEVNQATNVITLKEISSISTDKNYRQLRINANATLYVVTFEKPCSALRRSDVSVDDQSATQLGVGTELTVGKSSCLIKSIQRDLDLPAITTARDNNDPRQVLAGPVELRQTR